MNILTRRGRSVFKPAMLVSSVALALAIAGCNKGGGNVATVNGSPITRETLRSYLESTGGESALRQLIDNELVLQAAKKAGLEVTDAEVDKFIEDRRKENPAVSAQLDEIIKANGPRLEALRRQVRYNLATEKLVTKDIKVDPKALEKWYNDNKKNYSTPATAKVSLLISSTKARAETMLQQLKSKTRTFAQLIEDQKKANDPVAKRSASGEELPLDSLPDNLKKEVDKLKPNDISGVLSLGPDIYGIIRLESKVAANTPTLEQIRPRVEREYKQELLARETVKKNPQNPGFDETIQRVQQMLMEQNLRQGNMSQPSRADALQYINQTEYRNMLAKLATEADVQFNDPAYSRMSQEFTKPGTAPEGGAAPSGAAPSGAAPSGAAPSGAAPSGAPADGHGPDDGHGH